jgi:two-component system, chemotaxis family, protein-glutamate methylesterase/glutaminase
MTEAANIQAIVLGVSTGGMDALKGLLGALPGAFPVPILIVQHLSPEPESAMASLLDAVSALRVKEADEQETPLAGTVYLAPANYHLQVEPDGKLSLSTDAPVQFARPSVDVLFETAALAYGPALVGVVLTGAGSDGSLGLKCIKARGGTAIVQDPLDATCDAMPRSALLELTPDYVVTLVDLPKLLIRLTFSTNPRELPKSRNAP